MDDNPTQLPPAPQLVEASLGGRVASKVLAMPDPDGLPLRTKEMVTKAVNAATDHVIQELRMLRSEIDTMIGGLEATREKLHAHMETHFALGAEAVAFAGQVRERMRTIANGEASQPKPSETNGSGE